MTVSKRTSKKSIKPKETKTLTMNRAGEFMINATGPSHCGVLEDLIIKYNMVCVCGPKLDSRGFLFDQINIDNYFQNLKKTRKSCERLATSCLSDLKKLIMKENPDCQIYRLDLTLSPEPHKASMTYSWKSKNAPPEVRA